MIRYNAVQEQNAFPPTVPHVSPPFVYTDKGGDSNAALTDLLLATSPANHTRKEDTLFSHSYAPQLWAPRGANSWLALPNSRSPKQGCAGEPSLSLMEQKTLWEKPNTEGQAKEISPSCNADAVGEEGLASSGKKNGVKSRCVHAHIRTPTSREDGGFALAFSPGFRRFGSGVGKRHHEDSGALPMLRGLCSQSSSSCNNRALLSRPALMAGPWGSRADGITPPLRSQAAKPITPTQMKANSKAGLDGDGLFPEHVRGASEQTASFVPAALHPGHTGLCELRACWQPKGYLHGRRNCLRDSQDRQEDDGPTAFILNSQPKRLRGTVCVLGVVTDVTAGSTVASFTASLNDTVQHSSFLLQPFSHAAKSKLRTAEFPRPSAAESLTLTAVLAAARAAGRITVSSSLAASLRAWSALTFPQKLSRAGNVDLVLPITGGTARLPKQLCKGHFQKPEKHDQKLLNSRKASLQTELGYPDQAQTLVNSSSDTIIEQGTGLEGQLRGWKAAQVISGSRAQGKLKIQSHFPARLGKDKQIKCCFKFTGKKSSCLYMTQKQVNKFCQPTACHASRIPCMAPLFGYTAFLVRFPAGEPLQTENQILRADLRATTYTCLSAAVRNKGKRRGQRQYVFSRSSDFEKGSTSSDTKHTFGSNMQSSFTSSLYSSLYQNIQIFGLFCASLSPERWLSCTAAAAAAAATYEHAFCQPNHRKKRSPTLKLLRKSYSKLTLCDSPSTCLLKRLQAASMFAAKRASLQTQLGPSNDNITPQPGKVKVLKEQQRALMKHEKDHKMSQGAIWKSAASLEIDGSMTSLYMGLTLFICVEIKLRINSLGFTEDPCCREEGGLITEKVSGLEIWKRKAKRRCDNSSPCLPAKRWQQLHRELISSGSNMDRGAHSEKYRQAGEGCSGSASTAHRVCHVRVCVRTRVQRQANSKYCPTKNCIYLGSDPATPAASLQNLVQPKHFYSYITDCNIKQIHTKSRPYFTSLDK
ncbi:hypothetical protein Anapl_10744 [Anas platyrhynchos]|uniref:Uncharacterized protein n=1 Tax=Anas platyrhynchos TaxID=8839 RepID=R0L9V5_ANAPL|nr:hypothetical protein Anapl_10744 [Anas platyrhynchos]